jgi:hypothetical protein
MMATGRIKSVMVAFGLLALWPVGPAGAGQLEIKSSHPAHPDLAGYHWLKTTRMMRLEVSGPTHLGLRLRQVVSEGRPPTPVDLTVVRDDAEQGTVRFPVPAGSGSLSGEVLIRIDVPEGDHTYRLLVSGSDRGVVLQPFSGAIAEDKGAIVATPGGDRVVVPKPGPRRQPRPKPEPRPLEAPEEDLLGAVAVGPRRDAGPRTYHEVIEPLADPGTVGPRTLTLGSLAGVLLLSATGLAISGGVQESRAEQEPVQVRAGVYYDRAERTNQAAITVAVLGGAALVTALVYYYLEEPAGDPSAGAAIRF